MYMHIRTHAHTHIFTGTSLPDTLLSGEEKLSRRMERTLRMKSRGGRRLTTPDELKGISKRRSEVSLYEAVLD